MRSHPSCLPMPAPLYPNLEKDGIQWPLLPVRSEREAILPRRISRSRSKNRMKDYPLWIIPSGFHYHYGIGTTVKRAKGLAKVYPDSFLKVHPDDAAQAGLKDGDPIRGPLAPGRWWRRFAGFPNPFPKGIAYFATFFFPVFAQ